MISIFCNLRINLIFQIKQLFSNLSVLTLDIVIKLSRLTIRLTIKFQLFSSYKNCTVASVIQLQPENYEVKKKFSIYL